MNKDTNNLTCENNAEVEKSLEQVSAPAENVTDEKREWWLSVKYPDSACESER